MCRQARENLKQKQTMQFQIFYLALFKTVVSCRFIGLLARNITNFWSVSTTICKAAANGDLTAINTCFIANRIGLHHKCLNINGLEYSPLHLATLNGHFDMVEALISKGAKVNILVKFPSYISEEDMLEFFYNSRETELHYHSNQLFSISTY